MTIGERWWQSAAFRQRVQLIREMGFGDVRVYAGYQWHHFQPHTRAKIDDIVAQSKRGAKLLKEMAN